VSARRLVLSTPSALAAAAAEEFVRAAAGSIGAFRVALSGGNTPKALYELLAEPAAPFRRRIPWDRLHVFWSDERGVPPDHPDSNYRMAREALLSRVPVPPRRVHRIEGELPDSAEAARRYAAVLAREFGGPPVFDWIFLGLGADCHTASLFPGLSAVLETEKTVAAAWVDALKSRRVTLTLPVLNSAKRVVFLVAGADKATAARAVLKGKPSPARPASLVAPVSGEVLWLLDQAAASKLD
jgi:6-phosphogluconolactonase